MKKSFLLLILGLSLSVVDSKGQAADPTMWVTASIIGVDDCRYTERVDLWQHIEGPPAYDFILASATTQVGEGGCCPTSGVFIDLHGYKESLSEIYISNISLAAHIDDAIQIAVDGYANLEPATGLEKPFYLERVENPINSKIATVYGFDEKSETTVELYNSRGTLLRLYPNNPIFSDGLILHLMSEPDNIFFVAINNSTTGRSVDKLDLN